VARIVRAVEVVSLAAHLPFLAPTLEDIDSSISLGLQQFDVAEYTHTVPAGLQIHGRLRNVSNELPRGPLHEPRVRERTWACASACR
jgi:hypothetical protein